MMLEKFENSLSPELKYLLENKAPLLARDQNRNTIYPRDMVVCFWQEDIPVINKIVDIFSIEREGIYDALLGVGATSSKQRVSKKGGIDASTSFILQAADKVVTAMGHPFIDVEHVIYSFLIYSGRSQPTQQIKSIFKKCGMSEKDFRRMIIEDSEESNGLMDEIYKKPYKQKNKKNKPESSATKPERLENLRINLIKQGYI